MTTHPKPYPLNPRRGRGSPKAAKPSYIIIALGGSVIAPNGINIPYLKRFRTFIVSRLARGERFIIVTGGGAIARHYQNAISKIIRISREDKDWIGIHSTRLNAHLLRTVFVKESYPVVLDDPSKPLSKNAKKNLIIASGWRPGWSTDYIAVLLAKRFGVKRIIVAGHPDFVYTKDHTRHKDAKPIREISWRQYQNLISKKWTPGMKVPVDPVATRLAKKTKIEAVVIRGTNFKNFKNVINGKPFTGTLIN